MTPSTYLSLILLTLFSHLTPGHSTDLTAMTHDQRVAAFRRLGLDICQDDLSVEKRKMAYECLVKAVVHLPPIMVKIGHDCVVEEFGELKPNKPMVCYMAEDIDKIINCEKKKTQQMVEHKEKWETVFGTTNQFFQDYYDCLSKVVQS